LNASALRRRIHAEGRLPEAIAIVLLMLAQIGVTYLVNVQPLGRRAPPAHCHYWSLEADPGK
jgi:hypothetical protein